MFLFTGSIFFSPFLLIHLPIRRENKKTKFVMKKILTLVFGAGLVMPAIASAQTLQIFIGVIGDIVGMLVSICSMLALVVFFYGLGVFILNSGDEKKMEEGKSWMVWSIVAVFVLITIWGIIGFLQKTVGNTGDPGKVDIIIPRF